MTQADQDLQLKIWKELAISKQMLLRAATDALGLPPECTQDELREALEGVLKKVAKTEAALVDAKKEAAVAIAALEKKLASRDQELAAALKAAAEANAAHEAVVQQLASQRTAAAAELQKVKDRLAESEKSLKAINTALADTPANVLQKMSALKKQKQEEADARRKIESALNAMRAEKRQQDQRVTELQRNGTELASRHRELHALSLKLREQLQPLVEDANSLPAIPELDTVLLDGLAPSAGGDAKRPANAGALRAVNS